MSDEWPADPPSMPPTGTGPSADLPRQVPPAVAPLPPKPDPDTIYTVPRMLPPSQIPSVRPHILDLLAVFRRATKRPE